MKKPSQFKTEPPVEIENNSKKQPKLSFNKRWIVILLLLCSMFLVWALPAVSLTNELEKASKNAMIYDGIMDSRPSIYDFMFGGKKEVFFELDPSLNYDDTTFIIEYDNYVVEDFKYVIIFHVFSMVICLLAILFNSKPIKRILIAFISMSLVMSLLYITINITSQFIQLETVIIDIVSNYIGKYMSCFETGFSIIATFAIYIACIILSLIFYDEKQPSEVTQ